ncbi:MAG: hypothetical protein FJ148_28840 [Deltaproteobacteria bacterium]|nr:hypothetical protein [Deltaproteobacteria bacterium]
MSYRRALLVVLPLVVAAPAPAVQQVFEPAGASFYDTPFPMELRRDADGTVSLARFPFPPGNALIDGYRVALERTRGFGVDSGVFFKFDGAIEPATLPADPAASVAPGASVFLIDVDPRSKGRGKRTPLWIEFREAGDAWRDDHVLVVMPVPGHPLEPDTLYAAVVTDDLHGADAAPVSAAPFLEQMRAGAATTSFEADALPLYAKLWQQLEREEGLSREHVVGATLFRTGDPTAVMEAVARFVRATVRPVATNLALDVARSTGAYWTFTGNLAAPQFQSGTPPFSAAGSGIFQFDAKGRPVVQRFDTLSFVLTVPKERDDGTLSMPMRGWPIAPYMHGTGGSRNSFIGDGTAGRLAAQGIASLGIDQPLHGLRPGATADGTNFYNPLNPDALRDNPLQAAADSLVVHQLVRRLTVDEGLLASAVAGAGFRVTTKPLRFDRKRVAYVGHSQGATTGPLFLAVARSVQGGVISAGGGHLLANILSREQAFFAGLKLRDLVELLLGGPVDLFHPALHLLQMGSEVSDPVAYAPLFAKRRKGPPLSILFTHGTADGYVTTPMTAAMVVAAGYPLLAPTFPPISFPELPGYQYQEAFDLAGLPTLVPPVTGNLVEGRNAATGGLALYDAQGHFPFFNFEPARQQWTSFMRSLAYEDLATIPNPP